MGNMQIKQTYTQVTLSNQMAPKALPTRPQQTAPTTAMGQDRMSLSQIRSSEMNLQAKITELKLKEESYLSGMLNEQLDFLQQVASEQKDALLGNLQTEKAGLEGKLERISQYRQLLPDVVEYGSLDYAHHMQISDREQQVLNQISSAESRTMKQIMVLDNYVSNVRHRANGMIAKVNSHTLAGSGEMDQRIASLRSFLGELASSPISGNLIAARFN